MVSKVGVCLTQVVVHTCGTADASRTVPQRPGIRSAMPEAIANDRMKQCCQRLQVTKMRKVSARIREMLRQTPRAPYRRSPGGVCCCSRRTAKEYPQYPQIGPYVLTHLEAGVVLLLQQAQPLRMVTLEPSTPVLAEDIMTGQSPTPGSARGAAAAAGARRRRRL